MPVIRINAGENDAVLHGSPQSALRAIDRAAEGTGPVVAMIHGYKYRPGAEAYCPHRFILSHADAGADRDPRTAGWPRQLGFGRGAPEEGLALAFGWHARGPVWAAHRRARSAGQILARVLARLHAMAPTRSIHILAHSMGSEPALEALHHLPSGAVARMILMTGASYLGRARAALDTPAGRSAEVINVTSRENDLYDFLFERLVAPPMRGDRAIGFGLEAPNTVTLQLDCPETLDHLNRLGARIAQPDRRMCHWSAYTRPGALPFYARLMRDPAGTPLALLRNGLPSGTAPRWSRLLAPPGLALPLALPRGTA